MWFQGKLRVDWVELGYMSQRICLYDWDVKCVVGLLESKKSCICRGLSDVVSG